MKLSEYYTIDECKNQDLIFKELNRLQKENKISWSEVETDIIKVNDKELSDVEIKKLIHFFNENDINEYYDGVENIEDINDDSDDAEEWGTGDIYDF